MFALFFLHFVPFFSDWLNFVAQELKPKEKIYLVNKLHASCRLSHSAHIKTLRKTITITKRCRINRDFLDGPVLLWLAKKRLEKFGSKLLNKYKVLGLGILIYILPIVHSQESKCIRIHKYSLWCHCHPHQIPKYENVF